MSLNFRIGTSSRDDTLKKTVRENFPGPGNYTVKSDKGNAFRFGSEKRDWRLNSESPGPGQYHIPCSIVDVAGYQRSNAAFDNKYKFI